MMPPRSVYLKCNRSFHTLWARCFEGGGNVRSVQLYVCVCVVLMGNVCGAAWGGAARCA